MNKPKLILFGELTDKKVNVMSSFFAIFAGLLFGLIIMIITNANESFQAFFTILFGPIGGLKSIGKVLFYSTPIILTGLSVGFAFKTGLFNIGASGQLIVGAFVAVYIGVRWTFLGPSQWIVATLCAGLAGAFWASIPGILKAYRNVNEVVATIMMNYIGIYLVTYLVKLTIYQSGRNESQRVNIDAVIPSFGLENIFGPRSVNGGFFLAIIAVIIIYIILEKTTFGYELKAVGFNRDASKYAGINEKRSIILSMIISGFLAGLAGAVIYLVGTGKAIEVKDILPAEGFDGIPVALIGLSNPIGVFFAGIFMGYIREGGFLMQRFGFKTEIIDIIIASIIYFSALVIIFKEFILKAYKNKLDKKISRGDNNG